MFFIASGGIYATPPHFPISPASASSAASSSPAPPLIPPSKNPDIAIVLALLKQPESQIDLTRAKLLIDRLIDPYL
jgi:hypothetical protein